MLKRSQPTRPAAMSKKTTDDAYENQVQLERRAEREGRGRNAEWPSEIPSRGWKDLLWRVFAEVKEDRVMLIAAGAAFYLLLALFPALAAFVSIYGFVADPQTIAEHISFLGGVLPSGGLDVIRSQLRSLAAQDTGALSFGFIFGLAVALWSASNGIKTLFEAMNSSRWVREVPRSPTRWADRPMPQTSSHVWTGANCSALLCISPQLRFRK
ncbi:MAG: hypothetical protein EOS86_19670 [Mesorhizobium sp.]|nr:MAG: hypothetical protein EOS86_19670 [Mesorhizobium sp.]